MIAVRASFIVNAGFVNSFWKLSMNLHWIGFVLCFLVFFFLFLFLLFWFFQGKVSLCRTDWLQTQRTDYQHLPSAGVPCVTVTALVLFFELRSHSSSSQP